MPENTVINTILSDCRKAMLNRKPLIILRTNEIELVRQIVESDQLVVRLTKDCSCGIDRPRIVPTRNMKAGVAVTTKLFRQQEPNRTENFNIHYVTNDQLKQFSLSSDAAYGIPQKKAANDPFPALYIVQAVPEKPNGISMWDNANLNAFLDRFLLESYTSTGISGSVVLIYGDMIEVPPAYENYCEIIDEPYPKLNEIKECLLAYKGLQSPLKSETVDKIANALSGLPIIQVKHLLWSLSNTPTEDGTDRYLLYDENAARKEIQRYKSQILKKSNLLELLTPQKAALGGMKSFRSWIEQQEASIKESSTLKNDVGVAPPKGILLCGIPGCGKSEAVNTVAEVLDVPLLKLDVGQLMGKYVGESEHNMTKALRIAEAMSPCILFIDELDKGFSGAGGGSEDSSQFKRMFGTLLGWMQSCKEPCFIFATANDISKLPKEFFRSGRFDCLYSLYMPTAKECIEIFQKRMAIAERESGNNKLFQSDCFEANNLEAMINDLFAKQKRFVTGADITKLVNMALRRIWNAKDYSHASIRWLDWRNMIECSLKETTVYGDSEENKDSIALCYIRLLRSNFIPACDNPLFTAEHYHRKDANGKNDASSSGFPRYTVTVDDKMTVKEGGKEREIKLGAYDEALRAELKPLLEKYGALIEESALRGMI